MASFRGQEGLLQSGDAHWRASGASGNAVYGAAGSGSFGSLESGALERSNVDITEELVALISAQRNFQANDKAIETAGTMTQAIVNMRTRCTLTGKGTDNGKDGYNGDDRDAGGKEIGKTEGG